jgi:hypothetical protein
MKAVIILSCEGRVDKGFRFCSGVRNIILDLDGLEAAENYLDLITYLDNLPKIFDGPCCKSHIITNTIYKLYEMGFIVEEIYKRLSDFYKFHNRCGLILSAEPKE